MRDDSHKLKQAAQALDALQKSLTFKLREMEEVVVPAYHEHGFNSMPDDVVYKIVDACLQQVSKELSSEDYVYDKEYAQERDLQRYFKGKDDIRKLALVNRQFRDVVYSMGQCFNDFGYGRRLEEKDRHTVESRLAKYPTLPLDLCLGRHWHPIQSDFIKEASSLYSVVARNLMFEPGLPAQVTHQPVLLSKLVTARLEDDRLADEFFRAYSTPNLRSLSINNKRESDDKPLALPFGLQPFASLTELDITLKLYSFQESKEFLDALRPLKAIRNLNLTVSLFWEVCHPYVIEEDNG